MVSNAVRLLASPKLTVGFFLLTALSALAVAQGSASATLLMATPFALLGLNLAAAVATHARFRADFPLLLFHLALLALVLLSVFARLTYFDGHATLTRGFIFGGEFERTHYGPLHGEQVRPLPFLNRGFRESDPDGSYPKVINHVSWLDDASGQWLSADINNDRPLLLNGYRIYPRRFQGLAPLLSWRAANGAEEIGTVQLPPASRVKDFPKGIAWRLSNGTELWAMIQVKNDLPPGTRLANLGAGALDHVLVIWEGDTRHELRPGDSVDLTDGRLTYLSLDAWMGYRIIYDPTEPWLAAALVVTVGSLVWFYVRRLLRAPAKALE